MHSLGIRPFSNQLQLDSYIMNELLSNFFFFPFLSSFLSPVEVLYVRPCGFGFGFEFIYFLFMVDI
jgi:hypothetical protein